MLHFLKYLLLTLFLFAVLNLFRSNLDSVVSIKFQIPLIHEWLFPPVSLNYLLLTGFSAGILFAAFIGAFRFSTIREKKREIKRLKEELKNWESNPKEILPPSPPDITP
ncbi:MAG: hypothetical protein HY541_02320 [Deltaproteobacteria bacterium]|nr:hypothetical protein [Deltaproteobacteria bacterium]